MIRKGEFLVGNIQGFFRLRTESNTDLGFPEALQILETSKLFAAEEKVVMEIIALTKFNPAEYLSAIRELPRALFMQPYNAFRNEEKAAKES